MSNYESLQTFSAGAVSGFAGLIIGHPFDTIKTVVQSRNDSAGVSSIVRAVKTAGLTNFFRGLSLPFYSYTFINAITFSTFNAVLSATGSKDDDALKVCFAGAISGAAQVLPNVPVEVVKIQQQNTAMEIGKGISVTECMRQVIKTKGIRGFFSGGLMQAARDIPACAVYFFSYVQLNRLGQSSGVPQGVSILLAGAFSGVCSWVTTMPMDVLKTRLQANPNQTLGKAFGALMKEEGMLSLFRGTKIVIVRAFFVNAIIFIVYESMLDRIRSPSEIAITPHGID